MDFFGNIYSFLSYKLRTFATKKRTISFAKAIRQLTILLPSAWLESTKQQATTKRCSYKN